MTLLLEHTPHWLLAPTIRAHDSSWPINQGQLPDHVYYTWVELDLDGHTYPYADPRDAQNDAARGYQPAIEVLQRLRIASVATKLNPTRRFQK